MERDVADSREQANDKILRDILPIHDHLTLSIQHAKSEDGAIRAQELLDGVIMINDQLHAILSQHGLEPIPEDGAFDPRLHEAIATHDGEKGSVRTYQRGYRRGAKIVRPAKVSVAK
jgi:molecular chaperone GrpE